MRVAAAGLTDMTSAIKRLANAPCPAKSQIIPTMMRLVVYATSSGAMVPGLLQKCYCGCHFGNSSPKCKDQCDVCQGNNKHLIPAAEVMGVLVRVDNPVHLAIQWFPGAWKVRRVIAGNTESGYVDTEGEGDTPEEALAEAICQALGVE